MPVLNVHGSHLRTTAALSAMQVKKIIAPMEVIATLNRAQVNFVLVGAHGIAGWLKKPRAIQDVNLVVMNRHLKKATQSLLDAFPNLQARDEAVVVRFFDAHSDTVLINLIKQRELFREIFKHAILVADEAESYKVPTLEMAIAMKFAAMTSPNRPTEDRYQDAHDFIRMIRQYESIDQSTLQALGEHAFEGGGDALMEMIRKARAGESLEL